MKDIVVAVGSAIGSSLALIRAIRKEVHCRVYILCSNLDSCEILRASKEITDVVLIQGTSAEKYFDEVSHWYKTNKFSEKPILYFTYDNACYYVNKYRNWFEDKFELCLPKSEIVSVYTQKGIAEEAASKAGLKVPKTLILDKEGSVKQIIEFFSFPIIIKPLATYIKNNIHFKTKTFHTIPDFENFIKDISFSENTFLCQEFIPGIDSACFYYLFYRDRSGEVFENMGRKILQSPPGGGVMAKGMECFMDDLSVLSKSFLKTIDYKGIGGIEFKYFNGDYYFIEMSVRLEGFFKIAEDSKTPLGLLSYYDLSNLKENYSSIKLFETVEQTAYIDLLSTINAYRYQRNYMPLILDFFNLIFSKKVRLNIFSKKDVKPFFMFLKKIMK